MNDMVTSDRTATVEIISPLVEKVARLQAKGSQLVERLQQFGWPDTRAARTPEMKVDQFENYSMVKTVPEAARIPDDFVVEYHQWYAEVLALVETNMPLRRDEAVRLHERDSRKKDGDKQIVDFLNVGRINEVEQYRMAQYITQLAAIVSSIPHYIEGRLFDIEMAVANQYVSDQLREAEVLLKARHLRAAGAIAGVLLERHLKLLCDHHSPPIRYGVRDGISKVNDKLKEASVYDAAQWHKVRWMGDIRNNCAHPKTSEPTRENVGDLINEVRKFTALFTVSKDG